MEAFDISGGKKLLELCRGDLGSAELTNQLIERCVSCQAGLDAALQQIETTRTELQELLWKYSDSPVRVADNRLARKRRSGSSFDRGSYNFG